MFGPPPLGVGSGWWVEGVGAVCGGGGGGGGVGGEGGGRASVVFIHFFRFRHLRDHGGGGCGGIVLRYIVCIALHGIVFYCIAVCVCVRARVSVRACVRVRVCVCVCIFCIVMFKPLLMPTLCALFFFFFNCCNTFRLGCTMDLYIQVHGLYIIYVGEWGWGVEGKQVGSTDEESQVRGCYNITFICTPNQPGNSVCIGKDTSKQNI